jgi:hypothetical protein
MSSFRPRLATRVVAPPSGVSVGSRLRLTAWEQQLLTAIGAQLSRARAADLAAAQRQERANDRQKAIAARFGLHSRYAGSICVDNDAAVCAAKEQLWGAPAAAAGGSAASGAAHRPAQQGNLLRVPQAPGITWTGPA